MEEVKKCKSKEHEGVNAICYCKECNIYMCNKCSNYHTNLFENHHQFNLDKEKTEIFTGICEEHNHSYELNFYCKTHNLLCCAACISKLTGKGFGQHTNCKVFFIDDIKDEKKLNLKENLKYLENISFNVENELKELKKIMDKINEDKEKLKIEISKVFTKLRNSLNDREDELLTDIDKKYNDYFFNEKIFKQNEKLPSEIKKSLEIGKELDKEWDNNNNNKLISYINDCIIIENNVKKIKVLEENIKKNKSINVKLNFIPDKTDEINKFINEIKKFGEIKSEDIETIINLNSKIIGDNYECNKILKSWINQKDNINAELLYRLSRDGEKISKFHELCDNKGATLTIFVTEDGNKGGIFTPLSWDTVSEKKRDKDTFMFNLNNSKKYQKINENDASIWCMDKFGPWTTYFGFIKTMKNIEHRGLEINNCYKNGAEILPNNKNEYKYYNVKEIEVFKIIIE